MRRIEWDWVAVIVLILAFFGASVANNMIEADRFSDCLQRGGEMRKGDDYLQCKLPGAKP